MRARGREPVENGDVGPAEVVDVAVGVVAHDAVAEPEDMADAEEVADALFDLGAGDGKIAIAAARIHGARSVGIEFNPEMAALAKRNAERAGVSDRVTIINGDIFKEDFTKATVINIKAGSGGKKSGPSQQDLKGLEVE